MTCRLILSTMVALLMTAGLAPAADEPTAARRLDRAKAFHARAQERTGLLVPLYAYPGDVEKNPAFTRLIELKRRFETVPFWVIVNPDSGPGRRVDPNYTRAIDRLVGAGCVTIGYVSTSYGKRPRGDVQADVDRWRAFYPRVHGIFFDEMNNEDTDAAVGIQASYSGHAREAGFWPTVANPGTDTPGRYFAAEAADVFVVHEGDAWPSEDRMKGARPGGYADYPPFTRSILLHSRPDLDKAALRTARKYARWVYVTEDPYRPGDPKAENPWDTLSGHLGAICEALE